MIHIDSFGGKIGNICWQNTWNELWGSAGFWDKRPGVKGRFTLWGKGNNEEEDLLLDCLDIIWDDLTPEQIEIISKIINEFKND